MKNLFVCFALLSGVSALAQPTAPQLTISQPVYVGILSRQQTTQFLIASNVVRSGATAHYTAGQAVTLQSWFLAQAGAVFSATVKRITSSPEPGNESGLQVWAYPNPFADQITIEYRSPLEGTAVHTLMNASGQLIRQDQVSPAAGIQQLRIDGQALPAGIYLYRVQVGSQVQTLRLVKKS